MTAISATNTATATAGTSMSTARTNLTQTYDSFLKLLTTQMQYQDPLSPMDSAQFTSQLVQFSSVEQAIAQNEKLDQLIALQSGINTQAALGYIGLDVQHEGSAFAWNGDTPVSLSYNLPASAKTARYAIQNANGETVWTGAAETSSGDHTLTWDGSTLSGTAAPAGNYTFALGAISEDGSTVETKTRVPDSVEGIETADGETSLLLASGQKAGIDEITTARKPASYTQGE